MRRYNEMKMGHTAADTAAVTAAAAAATTTATTATTTPTIANVDDHGNLPVTPSKAQQTAEVLGLEATSSPPKAPVANTEARTDASAAATVSIPASTPRKTVVKFVCVHDKKGKLVSVHGVLNTFTLHEKLDLKNNFGWHWIVKTTEQPGFWRYDLPDLPVEKPPQKKGKLSGLLSSVSKAFSRATRRQPKVGFGAEDPACVVSLREALANRGDESFQLTVQLG